MPPASRSRCFPWSRIRRDYKPEVAGYYVLFEGLLGVVDGTLQETSYDKAKSEGDKRGGLAYDAADDRRLGGHHRQILADLAGSRSGGAVEGQFPHVDDHGDHYQVDYDQHRTADARRPMAT